MHAVSLQRSHANGQPANASKTFHKARELFLPALPALKRKRLAGVSPPRAQVKRDRVFEAVVAPEQFLAGQQRRRAEDAVHHGPLVLLAQAVLVLRRAAMRLRLAACGRGP